jgi:arylsulfatase A-like enzyme
LVSDDAAGWPQEVFLQISESQVGRAIRTKKWKYAVSAPAKTGGLDPDSELYVEEYLYDLVDDPHERRNLVREPRYAAIRGALSETLVARMAQAGESTPTIDPAL